MILEYYRPNTIDEALRLISRSEIKTFPMGGGSRLNQPSNEPFAVVDLQALGLNVIQDRGNFLEIGATTTLQSLMEVEGLQAALIQGIRLEVTNNLRKVATVAGTLVAAGGRSPFATIFLALDAMLTLLPGEETKSIGDLLSLRSELRAGRLITSIIVPLNAKLAYQYVARSPADQPIVCAAVARWPSGRTRVALGGWGEYPQMAFDGTEDSGAAMAAQNAYSHAGDQWASAEYRKAVAEILTQRCIDELRE